MKKLAALFSIIFILVSCNNEETNDPAAPLLQKVIFNPDTAGERHWDFNGNGLLSQITKADGTLVQTFSYDAQNRLQDAIIYNGNGTSSSYGFTYDSNDNVASCNGETLNYDAVQDIYYYGNLNGDHIKIKLNNEKVLEYQRSIYIDPGDGWITDNLLINASYTAENLQGYSTNNYQTCHSFGYDTNINPLKAATFAIVRAFSATNSPTLWMNGHYSSKNNVTSEHFCPMEDPESYTFEYEFNGNNLPFKKNVSFYYNGVFENSKTLALYYYQGDVIP